VHHHNLTGRRGTALARRAILGATAASMLVAAPAQATIDPANPVRTGHGITVFHNIDMIIASGYAEGEQVTIDVFRGAHRVATASGEAGGDEGAFEVNHEDAGCWEGGTPDVQPGDRIVVRTPNGADEAVFVDNVTIDRITREGDEVWLSGMAVDANGVAFTPSDTVLDSGEFRTRSLGGDVRVVPNEVVSGAGVTVGADATGVGGTVLPAGSYIAKYRAPFAGLDGRAPGNGQTTQMLNALATETDSHVFGYGHVEGALEGQLHEGVGPTRAPALGCTSEAFESSLGSISAPSINKTNAGPLVLDTAPVLTLGGWADGGIGAADVEVSDGTNPPKLIPVTGLDAATLPTGPDQGWTAVLTKEDLAGLQQGELTMRLRTAAGLVGASRTVQYNIGGPTFSVSLAPGTYTGLRSVALTRGPGNEELTYELDGGAPTVYRGIPIQLARGAHRLVVRATDAAGNTTEQAYDYTIVIPPAPQPQPQVQQQQQAPAPAPVILPVPQIAQSQKLGPAVRLLSSQKRIKGSAARRSGLVSRFSAPSGARTAVIRVYRSKGGKFTLVGSKSTSVRRGANSVKLNGKAMRRKFTAGLYAIQVTLRGANGSGAPATSMVRVLK
jgi:hypothetical protein